MKRRRGMARAFAVRLVAACLALWPAVLPAAPGKVNSAASLRLAIEDLTRTFGQKYPKGKAYLVRLEALETADTRDAAWGEKLAELRSEALLANPLVGFDKLLVVRSRQFRMPENYRSNIHIPPTGYDAEIAVLSPVSPQGSFRTIYRPPDADRPYVG